MNCNLCPRMCNVDRSKTLGMCLCSDTVKVARAAAHMWEEPCLSGDLGSGAIFFAGCSLHCKYCQNGAISKGEAGKPMTVLQLSDTIKKLEATGCHNINFVTPTHYRTQIVASLEIAKPQIPVLYNTSGYELAAQLKLLSGKVQIYLPDFKYMDSAIAALYSSAPDYPQVAKAAVAEMVRQQPNCEFDGSGIMTKGVIVRHLVLPDHTDDSLKIIRYLYETYGDDIYLSIMNQFTPQAACPELPRTVATAEYSKVVDFAIELGVTKAFIQEGGTASESFIPEFEV